MTFRRLCTLAALGLLLLSSGCCWHRCHHRPLLPWRRCCEPACGGCGACSACCAAPAAVDCGCSPAPPMAPPLAGPFPGPVMAPPHGISPPAVETIAPMPKAVNGLH